MPHVLFTTKEAMHIFHIKTPKFWGEFSKLNGLKAKKVGKNYLYFGADILDFVKNLEGVGYREGLDV